MTSPLSRRRSSLVAGLVAVAFGASALTAAPAHAESWTHRDKVNDVWQMDLEGDDTKTTKAPRGQSVDVRRIRITHSASRVVIVTRAPKIKRSNHSVLTLIQTPRGGAYLQLLANVPGIQMSLLINENAEEPDMADEDALFGSEMTCRGMRARIVPNRAVRISIPRRCLGDPNWVRVGQLVSATRRTTATVDDALGGGRMTESSPRMSKRLFRG